MLDKLSCVSSGQDLNNLSTLVHFPLTTPVRLSVSCLVRLSVGRSVRLSVMISLKEAVGYTSILLSDHLFFLGKNSTDAKKNKCSDRSMEVNLPAPL